MKHEYSTLLVDRKNIQTLWDIPIVVLALYFFAEIVLCGWSLNMDVSTSQQRCSTA
jgi:hypothetical protein